MGSYMYGSALYRTRGEAVDALVGDWLTAQGSNGAEYVAEVVGGNTDRQLAAEMVDVGWDTLRICGERDDDGGYASEQVTMDDLMAAVARYRAAL